MGHKAKARLTTPPAAAAPLGAAVGLDGDHEARPEGRWRRL